MTTDNQNEILVVVNQDDQILDYLPRSLVHEQKLLHRTISVSIFNDQGQILLQRRSSKKDNNPGKWANAAGGHVNKREGYEQTAQNEVSEELGINPDLVLIKKMKIDDPAHTTMTSIYKAYSNGPFKFNTEEIDEIKFYSKEQLRGLNLSESAKIVLKEQGLI